MPFRDVQAPEIFIGREKELDVLKATVLGRRRWLDPLIIQGPGGIGKTALVSHFLHENLRRNEFLWFVDSGEEAVERLHFEMRELMGRRDAEDVTVIVDGEDSYPPNDRERILRAIQNFKRVRKVIITTREKSAHTRGEVLTLTGLSSRESSILLQRTAGNAVITPEIKQQIIAFANGHPYLLFLAGRTLQAVGASGLADLLNGKIYDIAETLSDSKILTVAKPQIILANTNLILRLQREPKAIFELTSRKFEEVLADLLKDMGYDVELTQATRDGGRDILAWYNTPAARMLCLVEAKRYRETHTVGVELVRTLFGTLHHYQANSAMLVTTSKFSPDARAFRQQHEYQLNLRDYGDVVNWIQGYKQKPLAPPKNPC